MNINFLPSKVKENIKKICNDKMILNAARSNTTINGENGEGYLIDLGDKIIFMSRKMGENDFSVKEFSDKIIGKIIKDNFNVYLNIKTSLDENKIKFSSLEENDLAKIAKKLLTISDNENQKKDLPQANAEGNFEKDNKKSDNIEKKINDIDNNSKIQPIILFGAAMMYIAKSDQIVAKEEDFYVISMLNYNKELLKKSLEYFKTTSYEKFLSDCKKLTSEQKLCILANMNEIAMKDSEFDSSEQKMINSFVKILEIDVVEYETIRNVLLIKNNLSVFFNNKE